MKNIGIEMHKLCEKLFPICRSITGAGFRESLKILKNDMQLNDLNVFEVATGTKCFDWEVPKEWNIRDAYIITPDGKKICDFQNSGAVSLYKVNKELLFFFFGQAFVAENKDLCLNLVKGLFTEIADMNQSFIGKRIHNVLDHKIARSFQSVVRTNGKFDIIDIGLTSFFGKSDADADLRPDDLVDRIQKAVFLCGIVKLQRNFFFSHIA